MVLKFCATHTASAAFWVSVFTVETCQGGSDALLDPLCVELKKMQTNLLRKPPEREKKIDRLVGRTTEDQATHRSVFQFLHFPFTMTVILVFRFSLLALFLSLFRFVRVELLFFVFFVFYEYEVHGPLFFVVLLV